MSEENKPVSMGAYGEQIISRWFRANGSDVVLSESKFDSEKDMIIDGLHIEVKTQVPFVTKDAFTFRENQLKKCLRSDKTIFISVPTNRKPHHSDGKVYELAGKDMKFITDKGRDGRDQFLIPINQKGMKELFTITKEDAEILKNYSSSKWV